MTGEAGEGKWRYCIDTSSLLYLKRHYPMAIFPSVWSRITDLADSEALYSSREVFEELKRSISQDGCEALSWAKRHPATFHDLCADSMLATQRVLAAAPDLLNSEKPKSNQADPFVIAHAMIHGAHVVTEERPSSRGQRPKIPDVCRSLGVPSINVHGLFSAVGWTF